MSIRSISFDRNAISAPRIHYERVVYDVLRMLWTHKPLVAAVFGVALGALLAALMLIAPRYTGEAMIKMDFTRDETVGGEKVQSIAAVDAAALVDGAARIIRSRGTASAVVSVLGLDNDPDYTRLSLPERALSAVWSAFGQPAPTPREVAVAHLMRQITVTNDPRAYLITVAVTVFDSERAARLANWVASEYLRGRQRQQAIEALAVAQREMTALSSVLGPRHPSYLTALAKLERMKAELAVALEGVVAEPREGVVAQEMVRFAAGQVLLPAETVRVPSGPNTMLLFALTVLAALAAAILLSSLAERGLLRWSVALPAVLRRRSLTPLA
jgi:uncharacterized protein involved in exopolysaccharide biosynthesis